MCEGMGIYYDIKIKSIIYPNSIVVNIYSIQQGDCVFNALTIITASIGEGLSRTPIVLAAVWITAIIVKVPKLAAILAT